MRRAYGCLPDFKDKRDYPFKLSWFSAAKYMPTSWLPATIDLSASFPPLPEQSSEGCCVMHSITTAMRYYWMSYGMRDVRLSRNQGYYDARKLEGTVNQDAGIQIRDGMKVAAETGLLPENLWPYDVTKWMEAPPTDGPRYKIDEYLRVEVDPRAVQTTLYVGHPVIIGIDLYQAFESDEVAATGMVPMPPRWGATPIGRHSMLLGKWNVKEGHVSCANWWDLTQEGFVWGDQGWCHIPIEYACNPDNGADFWVIDTVKEPS